MAKETKEQRAEREAREKEVAEEAYKEYLKTVPNRLMEAQTLAHSLGVSTHITLDRTGPLVNFFDDNENLDETCGYQTTEWELEYLERRLKEIKEKQNARKSRYNLAETVWNRLSKEEKTAIKEFSHLFKG